MKLEEIKAAIAKLGYDEFWEFAKWFNEYQNDLWDKEIEEDGAAGRLDALADKA